MASSDWVGKTLGNRYSIESLLGQGGMSAVYKAEDPNLRRTVAVKLIHSHLSDDAQFVSRFEEEAAAVAQLRHPNIIQVFDFEHDGETYYMVMEFVPGETLQDRLKRLNAANQRLSAQDAAKFAAEVCDALDYAHKRGMIHRDIKPANIMLNVQGEAILMDFGIAKIVGGKRHTATGAVVGTALYMSPEQIKGEQIDPRVDIYAMGVTLFEMLSGRPPFEADSAMTTLMMHVNDPVPDLAALNPNVPPALVQVVGKALAKNRDNRFRTAAEFAAALRNVFTQRPGAVAATGATMIETEVDPIAPVGATMVETESAPVVPGGATTVEPSAPAPAYDGTLIEQPPQPAAPVPAQTGTGAPAAPPPPIQAPSTGTGGGLPINRLLLFGGGGLIVIVVAIILGVSLLGGLGGGGDENTPVAEIAATAEQLATEAAVVVEPTNTPPPPPTATETPPPTETPTITPTPTETEPAGPFVRIDAIRIENNRYVVDYTTFGYTEQLPGMHIHFFYDTVTEENAGSPGSGPWILYGGPRPFQDYTVGSRPAQANQMCALVANQNHTIIPGSGTCVDLPEG